MPTETPYPPDLDLLTGTEVRSSNHCLRHRGTPVPLLIHTRSGSAVVRAIGEDERRVTAGDTVLWAAGAPQDFECVGDEPWEIVWAHFQPRPAWKELLVWPAVGPGIGLVRAPDERMRGRIDAALVDAAGLADSGLPKARQLALNAVERALLWLSVAAPTDDGPGSVVREAVLYISQNLDRRLTVADLAATAGLSRSRFAHVFRAETGVSPARFVELRRIDRARTLLDTTTLTIATIARATGFSNQFYFSTRFSTVSGKSPSAWRERPR